MEHDYNEKFFSNIREKRSVIQLYKQLTYEEPIDLKPEASGVLITIDDNYYLLTAGHVYKDCEFENIGFFSDGFFFVIQGEIKYTLDDIDMAVCKLNQATVEELIQKYDFLPSEKIRVGHKLTKELKYYIYGFPTSKTKIIRRYSEIRLGNFQYLTVGVTDSTVYEAMKLDADYFYLLDYHRKKLIRAGTSLKQESPVPNGLSGTGLWYLDGDEMYLIGIMTAWDDGLSVMQATIIDLLLDMIYNKF